MIITETNFTTGLTDLINNLCAPKQSTMQLIHISDRAQFVRAVTKLMVSDKWPCVFANKFTGECYIENTDNYLVYDPTDWNVAKKENEIIEFVDFINQAL